MFAEYFWKAPDMSSDQQSFAQQVLDGFLKANLRTDKDVEGAGGPSSTWMTALRKVARGEEVFTKIRSDTLSRIDDATGWPEGSSASLWYDGLTPIVKPAASQVQQWGRTTSDDDVDSTFAWLDERVERLEARILKVERQLRSANAAQSSPIGGGDELKNRRAAKTSGPDESLEPAADDVIPDADEKPGGSDDLD